MRKRKPFPYVTLHGESRPPFLGKRTDLQSHYALCNRELGLQQTKRDQLVGFYIGILGVAAVFLASLEIPGQIRGGICLVLFLLGYFWLGVALRYRICKEVYDLSCQTLLQLYCAALGTVSKALVQHAFYKVMVERARNLPRRHRLLAYIWSSRKSAEFGMFKILAVFTAGAGGVGLWMLGISVKWTAVITAAFLIWQTVYYHSALLGLYQVTVDRREDSFDRVYSMARHLHFFA